MILHGLDARIEQGDTIRDPKFKEEDNPLELRTFDKVMANFPFSLENWAQNGEPKKDKKERLSTKKTAHRNWNTKKGLQILTIVLSMVFHLTAMAILPSCSISSRHWMIRERLV